MIGQLFDFVFHVLTNPDRLIEFLSTVLSGWYGYAVLFAIVFAETGLLAGFFFPGDSLLFTVGVVAGAGHLNVAAIIALLSVAAILGDAVGYSIGRHAGPLVFDRPSSKWFKREHLVKTQEFYQKHGGKTIIYARFVPIIRTFAPFVAGVGQMSYARFATFNIVGGIAWVVIATLAGYFLGEIPFVKRHFEKVVIGIVLVSVLPIVIEYLRARRRA